MKDEDSEYIGSDGEDDDEHTRPTINLLGWNLELKTVAIGAFAAALGVGGLVYIWRWFSRRGKKDSDLVVSHELMNRSKLRHSQQLLTPKHSTSRTHFTQSRSVNNTARSRTPWTNTRSLHRVNTRSRALRHISTPYSLPR